jgi:hypothetical protein
MLSERQLQNTLKVVFTNEAEFGKASAVAAAAILLYPKGNEESVMFI